MDNKNKSISCEKSIKEGFILYFSLIYDMKNKENQELYRTIFINCIDSEIIDYMIETTIEKIAADDSLEQGSGDFYKAVYKEVGKELNKFIKIKINKAVLTQELARVFNIIWSDLELKVKYKVNSKGLNEIRIYPYNYNLRKVCVECKAINLVDIVKQNIFSKSINEYFVELLEKSILRDDDFDRLKQIFNNIISNNVIIEKEV